VSKRGTSMEKTRMISNILYTVKNWKILILTSNMRNFLIKRVKQILKKLDYMNKINLKQCHKVKEFEEDLKKYTQMRIIFIKWDILSLILKF